jgi:carbon monoxide dehydrogenase subunit G
MARFTQSVHIAAAPEAVYAFVTNAAQWHTWHPATHSVRDVPDRPLVLGETMVEEIRAGLRHFDAKWQVIEHVPPRRWAIETRTPLGHSTVSYELTPQDGGTRFQRTCEFASTGAWSLLDGTALKWMLQRQATKALENLRRRLAG